MFVPCVMTTPSAWSRSSQAADRVHEVGEVGVGDGVGAEAAERDLGDVRDRRQLGRHAGQQRARFEPHAGLEVPGEVQAVRAQRVDGAAGRDDGDAGQGHVAGGSMETAVEGATSPGCQCGAASGGVNRATRSISRRIRSPSTGPSA